MSAGEASREAAPVESHQPPTPTEPAAMAAATATKKRPRLDLEALTGSAGRERKRGKSMFGLVVGTLNKAKIEDRERNASEAAKKRQLIEQRLQNKLRKETDSVRRAEEAKKDKMAANRKEEELQLKDSIYKFRRTRLPLLANFLLTSDNIPTDDSSPTPPSNPLTNPPRTHPPPLYYLPAILLPAQESFLERRKHEVSEAAEKEYTLFREERSKGIEEVHTLRQRVADEEARKKEGGVANDDEGGEKMEVEVEGEVDSKMKDGEAEKEGEKGEGAEAMDVDVDCEKETERQTETEGNKEKEEVKAVEVEAEKKEEPLQADDDEAVEY